MSLSTPESADRITGGFGITETLDEERHRELALPATALFDKAIADYAFAAGASG